MNNILSNLPNNCDKMIDAFGGSGTVCANMPHRYRLYNELDKNVFDIVFALATISSKQVMTKMLIWLKRFKLSSTNQLGYYAFREYANKKDSSLAFLLLHYYSFSNMLRFNAKNKFNAPLGKGRYGEIIHRKQEIYQELAAFKKSMKVQFTNLHYADLLNKLSHNLDRTFIYFDPPYLASGARSYTSKWSADDEKKLLGNLDKLDKRGVKWMLSNVLTHKGLENKLLIEWSKKYRVIPINKKYVLGARYKNTKPTQEVLIMNY